MKKFKALVASLILLAIVVGVVGYSNLSPTYKGNLQLAGLSAPVKVTYDENGVPHIKAQNQKDAYRALGYVHAQDRLWQMELMRRITAGRLSEILGKDLVDVDKFMGSLGVEEQATKTIAKLDKTSQSYQLSQAYLEGINTFIDTGPTPIEFLLLGIDKQHYTLKDTYNIFGYMAFSFASAFKVDPLMTSLNNRLDPQYVTELLNLPESKKTFIEDQSQPIIADFSGQVSDLLKKIPVPLIEGSNSWVVAPQKTKNGKVILENDPHISFAQPSIWYQAHVTTPDYDFYGFHLPLVAFPLLGHNQDYAFGITMYQNDDVDFYVEQNHPTDANLYAHAGNYLPYETRNKTIKVKDGEDLNYQIKVSHHGPVLTDVMKDIKTDKPVAMQWTYTKVDNQALQLVHELSHAKTLADFKKGVAKLHAPGLNFMYGDAKGNIAQYGAARLHTNRKGLNTKMFLDGSSGDDEVLEYLDFTHNTQIENPATGYVYSANNQHGKLVNGQRYPGYYSNQDRAKRIVNLLEAKNDFTSQDMQTMAIDNVSDAIPLFVQQVNTIIDTSKLSTKEKQALEALKQWDGDYRKDSIAATIYNRFIYTFFKATYADEMGATIFDTFMETIHEHHLRALQIERKNSIWWDDVTTTDKRENRKDIVTQSFKNTVAFLGNQLGDDISSWRWDKVFKVEHPHALGKGSALLKKIFTVGPFASHAGDDVINKHGYHLTKDGYYTAYSGPSTRRIIDFADVNSSKAILPTGQSGNVLSEFYKDQAQKYLRGEYVLMYMDPKDYADSNNVVTFSP